MNRLLIFLAAFGFMFSGCPARAQYVWLQPKETSVVVEWLRPSLRGVSSTFLTSVVFVSARLPLSQSITLVGDLALAYFGGVSEGFRDNQAFGVSGSSGSLGNPYFGMEISKQALPLSVEFGVRLPLGRNLLSPAATVGQATDTERFEAFTDYSISAKARLHYRRNLGSGYRVHLRAGWSGGHDIAQEGISNFSTLDYGIELGYHAEKLFLIGGLSGRYLLDGRTFHMARLGHTGLDRRTQRFFGAAGVDYGSVQPGVFFSLLLDDYVTEESRRFVDTGLLTDEVRFVFGLNLVVALK